MAETTRQQKLDALLGRALRDKAFRDRLVENPEEAAKEAALTPEELGLVAGGLAIGGGLVSRNFGRVMFCTEKTCNEKGGARVVIDSPDFETPVIRETLDAGEVGGAGKVGGSGEVSRAPKTAPS